MKKKIIIAICILLAVILIFPMPLHYKDGGSVEYKALLYSVKKVHSLTPLELSQQGKMYYEGFVIKIFGVEIFNNVK